MPLPSNPGTAAERLLNDIWGEKIPVDPVAIARSLGIQVLNAQLGPTVSGALSKEIGQDPKILLNSDDSANRKRFTCAHEIGHFVKRFSNSPQEYEYVDLRSDLSSTGLDEEERFANAFAASLLMPEKHVRRLHQAGLLDFEMALRFDVSAEAMQFRLKNLGLL